MKPRNTQLSLSTSDITSVEWSYNEEGSNSSLFGLILPRTHRLILDYKQFKAAQHIQRYVRGWLVRLSIQKYKLAAIVIQKYWRRFMAHSLLVIMAEKKVKLAIISHYNACATRIQKVFRGWWCRKHVNNLTKLKSMQHSLAEYLIRTLGIYMHEAKHKGDIPGLYCENLPESCSETIDQMLSSLDYRIYNSSSCYQMQQKLTEVNDLRKEFEHSTLFTYGPYRGFDECERFSAMDAVEETQENVNLIRAFVCMKNDLDMKSKFERSSGLVESRKERATTAAFFRRIALDMKKWHDKNGKALLPRHIFRTTDIKALLDVVKIRLEDVFGQLEPCLCETQIANQ